MVDAPVDMEMEALTDSELPPEEKREEKVTVSEGTDLLSVSLSLLVLGGYHSLSLLFASVSGLVFFSARFSFFLFYLLSILSLPPATEVFVDPFGESLPSSSVSNIRDRNREREKRRRGKTEVKRDRLKVYKTQKDTG